MTRTLKGILISAVALLPFAALASGSATVQSLSPSGTVSLGTTVSFTVVPSDFTSPYYTLSDDFGGTSISASNFNNGAFSWTPTIHDVGVHDLSIIVNDSMGNYAAVNQTIIVNPLTSMTIQSVFPGSTVSPGQNLTFSAATVGFSNQTYTINDSLGGNTISTGVFDTNGNFSWTPTVQDVGSHTLTVNVTDPYGHTATANTTIVVSGVPSIVVSTSTVSVLVGTPVNVIATTSGFSHAVVFSASDTFAGGSFTTNSINTSTGVLAWSPLKGDIGVHQLNITAYDVLANASVTKTVLVTVSATTTPVTYGTPKLLPSQISAILSLLQSFGADQTVLNNVSLALNGQAVAATPGTTSSSGYVFSTLLQVGMTSTDVTELQKRLTTLGVYSGPISGYFGSLTEAAVKKFQGTHGLDVKGWVGPGTRAALNQ